jgi:hypothetical protein
VRSQHSRVLFPEAAEIRARFLARTEPVIGGAAADVAALVDGLEQLNDLKALTDLLIPQAEGVRDEQLA